MKNRKPNIILKYFLRNYWKNLYWNARIKLFFIYFPIIFLHLCTGIYDFLSLDMSSKVLKLEDLLSTTLIFSSFHGLFIRFWSSFLKMLTLFYLVEICLLDDQFQIRSALGRNNFKFKRIILILGYIKQSRRIYYFRAIILLF